MLGDAVQVHNTQALKIIMLNALTDDQEEDIKEKEKTLTPLENSLHNKGWDMLQLKSRLLTFKRLKTKWKMVQKKDYPTSSRERRIKQGKA